MKKWIVAQISAGAKSFFGDHAYYMMAQKNMTSHSIDVQWSSKAIVFRVLVKSSYLSFMLRQLRMPPPKLDGKETDLKDVSGCPKFDESLTEKKRVVQCAFNMSVDPKTRLCHGKCKWSGLKSFVF